MRFADVAMIAADTSRSRVYLQALARHDLLPSFVLILGAGTSQKLPGQVTGLPAQTAAVSSADCWSEASFDAAEDLQTTLRRTATSFDLLEAPDINDPSVIAAVTGRPEQTLIFSGYGGALLRAGILAAGRRFLHVHGGYLPDYKGSTTNYYSLLDGGRMGASALFLNEEIDSGTVLLRRRFPAPPNRQQIDHVYDAAARAKVLVETLRAYHADGRWPEDPEATGAGETYFIIHPVLKHIAILENGGQPA